MVMESSKRTVKLGLVGCGGIADAHLYGYERIKQVEPDKFEIVSVCDPIVQRAERAADWIERFQGKHPRVYADLEEMLKAEDENLDGTDITTPHHLHHVNAIACMESGIHVLVEKPIGVTVKATQAIVESAKRTGKFAATAENCRRQVPHRTAWWLFNKSRLIGNPTFFYAIQVGYNPPPPAGREPAWHWRVDRFLSGGGLVLDSGAHFCDTIRYIFGDVKQVHAVVKQLIPRPHRKGDEIVLDDREDTWMAVLEFESGVTGFWSYTSAAPTHRFTHVVYYATEGALVDTGDVFHGPVGSALVQHQSGRVRRLGDLAQDFRADIGDEEWNRLFPHGFTDGFTLECYDFLDAIQNNRSPEVTAEDGLKAKAISFAIYEAATTGRTVKMADLLSGEVETYQRPINERWGL